MNRKLKAIGLALVAVFAMSAFLASGAQARTFTASSYPAKGTGEQKAQNVFTVQGQKVECAKAHFAGELGAASHELTITPTYTECTGFLGISVTVDMNSCDYNFTIDNPTENSVHILCTKAGDSITVTAGPCTIHIPAQTPTTNVVDYENSEGGVLVTSTVEGIHSKTVDGFLCPLNGSTETDTSGTYKGTVLFKGLEGKTADVG